MLPPQQHCSGCSSLLLGPPLAYLHCQGGDDALGVDQAGVAKVVQATLLEDLHATGIEQQGQQAPVIAGSSACHGIWHLLVQC